jgi:chemotaxis protein CheD
VSGERTGGGKAEVAIHVGGVYATRKPTIIRTLLGSCVAVCMFDPITRVGGMNHFMLPAPAPGREAPPDYTRFGVHAMDCLIGALQKEGGDRRRLEAKVFGGGHVLEIAGNGDNVAQRNIAFIDDFLRFEEIPVVGRDLGGELGRQLYFHTDTGKVYVRRLRDWGRRQLRTDARAHRRALAQAPPRFGEILLFEP